MGCTVLANSYGISVERRMDGERTTSTRAVLSMEGVEVDVMGIADPRKVLRVMKNIGVRDWLVVCRSGHGMMLTVDVLSYVPGCGIGVLMRLSAPLLSTT